MYILYSGAHDYIILIGAARTFICCWAVGLSADKQHRTVCVCSKEIQSRDKSKRNETKRKRDLWSYTDINGRLLSLSLTTCDSHRLATHTSSLIPARHSTNGKTGVFFGALVVHFSLSFSFSLVGSFFSLSQLELYNACCSDCCKLPNVVVFVWPLVGQLADQWSVPPVHTHSHTHTHTHTHTQVRLYLLAPDDERVFHSFTCAGDALGQLICWLVSSGVASGECVSIAAGLIV